MNGQTKNPKLQVQEFEHKEQTSEKADAAPDNSFTNPAAILKKVGGVGDGDAPEFALVSEEFVEVEDEDEEGEVVNSFSNPAASLMKFGTVAEGDVPVMIVDEMPTLPYSQQPVKK